MLGGFLNSYPKAFPCMNCPDRKVGCHGKCEKYKTAAAANEKTKQKIRDGCAWIAREPEEATRKRAIRRNKGYEGRNREKYE